jgi:hypothetical protein
MTQETRAVNYSRLALGAVVASVTLFVGELVFIALIGGRLMAARQAAGMPEFVPQPLLSVLEVLMTGTFIVWLYTSIRLSYGSGPLTAIKSGIAAWFGLVLLSTLHMIGESLGFPVPLLMIVALAVLPIFVFASVLGAWAYRD